jgi:hypothetical protein
MGGAEINLTFHGERNNPTFYLIIYKKILTGSMFILYNLDEVKRGARVHNLSSR